MGCNCGKKSVTGKYVWIAPDGSKHEANSEIEAMAEKIRGGGGGVVQPA